MAAFNDDQLALGAVYSTAMLKLARARGEADSLEAELLDLAAYLEGQKDFEAFLSSLMVGEDVRQRTVEKLFRGKYSDLLVDSLQVLNRKGRLGMVRVVAEAYRLALEETRGRMEVEVRTAAPLTDALRERLRTVLEGIFDKKVDFLERVDELLLGGLVLKAGDRKYDASIARQLSALRQWLLARASQELHRGRRFVTDAIA